MKSLGPEGYREKIDDRSGAKRAAVQRNRLGASFRGFNPPGCVGLSGWGFYPATVVPLGRPLWSRSAQPFSRSPDVNPVCWYRIIVDVVWGSTHGSRHAVFLWNWPTRQPEDQLQIKRWPSLGGRFGSELEKTCCSGSRRMVQVWAPSTPLFVLFDERGLRWGGR
jgi:hypothetical protein